jgi:AcrR family transcriptional regulator
VRYDTSTRAALIESAGEVFAEVGFEAASIRAICVRAGANIAAVHYHFGTKEALYEAVCGNLFPTSPPALSSTKPRSSAAAARGLVKGLVDTLLSPEDTWRSKIVRRELMAPTPAVTGVIARALAPRWAVMEDALGRVAPGISVIERRRLLAALVGELLFLRDARPLLEAMHGAQVWAADREALISRITKGLLGRIASVPRPVRLLSSPQQPPGHAPKRRDGRGS